MSNARRLEHRRHALGQLSHHAFAELAGLCLTGAPYRQSDAFQLSERVRDVAMYRGARLGDSDRDQFIHNAADRLTPTIAAERADAFSLLGAAQTADLRLFARHTCYRDWYNADLVREHYRADVCVGRALYLAYREAVARILAWMETDASS